MTIPGRGRSWVRLVIIMVLALAVLGTRDDADAQEATTVAPISTEAPDGGVGESVIAASQQAALSGSAKAWLVGGLLALAVVTVVMHYVFLSQSRREYFRTAALLFQQGIFPRPVPIAAQGGAPAGGLGVERMEGDDAAAPLAVIGPATLMRGQAGVYVALLNGARADDASWAVEPAGAATLNAAGAVASVSAARVGTFTLTAALPGQQGVAATQTVAVPPEAAPDPDAPAVALPFLGQGFASLVGAVVLIAAVVVLAAVGVEDWAVIGTIFGALAGYLFGTAAR